MGGQSSGELSPGLDRLISIGAYSVLALALLYALFLAASLLILCLRRRAQ